MYGKILTSLINLFIYFNIGENIKLEPKIRITKLNKNGNFYEFCICQIELLACSILCKWLKIMARFWNYDYCGNVMSLLIFPTVNAVNICANDAKQCELTL